MRSTNPCGFDGHCGILVPHSNHMNVEDLASWLSEHGDDS